MSTPVEPMVMPCPFCGAQGVVRKSRNKGKLFWVVGCETKGCREYHYRRMIAVPDDQREAEIAAWNRRAMFGFDASFGAKAIELIGRYGGQLPEDVFSFLMGLELANTTALCGAAGAAAGQRCAEAIEA